MKSTTNYKQMDTGQYFSTSPRGQKNYAHISQAEAFLLVACLSVACLLVAYCVLSASFCLFPYSLHHTPYTVFVACLPVACSLLLVAFFLSPFRLYPVPLTPYSLHHTPSFPTASHILFSIKSVNYAPLSLSLSLSLSRARARA
jgi:hypothetical protein